MILELINDWYLAEEVPGEGVEMKDLTAKATLKVKNLDEIEDAKEFVTALRQYNTPR